ncbi:PaaI family thioesterase [Symbiobacterium terraclitae]|uniref:PaaI family thioesterase n=1 Tax=Symbiobacterium terraclitae TaxID=557451 RepID=UPI0035B5117F
MGRIPFREVIGAEVVEAGHGRSVVRMPASEHTLNNLGIVHGGALCTLADAAIGTALRSALQPGDAVATIEMKVNFIAPGRGDLLARARTLHLGGTTAVAEAEIEDVRGALVAKALATFFVKHGAVEPRPGARTAMDPDVDGPEPRD